MKFWPAWGRGVAIGSVRRRDRCLAITARNSAKDHRRGAPDPRAVDGEIGHVHHHLGRTFAAALLPPHGVGVAQERQRHLDQALDLGLGDAEVWPCGGHADHRVQQVTRHRHVERRQPAEDLDGPRRQTHFLVGLAQRRGLDRLAGIDPPARQRNLAGVMPQRRRRAGSAATATGRRADRRGPTRRRRAVRRARRTDPSPGAAAAPCATALPGQAAAAPAGRAAPHRSPARAIRDRVPRRAHLSASTAAATSSARRESRAAGRCPRA